MINENDNRPWLDSNGEILPDQKIRAIAKNWSPDVWEQFLVETVEGSSAYQREKLLWPYNYDQETEAKNESIWENIDSPETEAIAKTVRRLCRDRLTPRQQQVIRCIFWDGFSEGKTARMMGITRSTVAVQKERALKKLKKLIERELPQFSDDKNFLKSSLSKNLPKRNPTFGSLSEGVAKEKSLQKASRYEDIKNVYEEEIGKSQFSFRRGDHMRALKEELVLVPTNNVLEATEYQHVIEKGLMALSELERRAIFLRFWEPNTIAQVADQLFLKWEEADQLIDQAVKKIQIVIKEHNTRKARS